MKVLVDTNILLDVLCSRQEFLEDSAKLFRLCEVSKVDGYISALSIPNIMYILRKELDPDKAKDIYNKLTLIFTVCDLKADDLKKATDLKFKDFEDAVQSVCAARIRADYIVTRNIKDFSGSKVPAVKPAELFDRL